MTMIERRKFAKYDETGAYHWAECDRRSRTYNPPLVARYQCVVKRVPSGKSVLDIGCGDGYLMHCLSPTAKHVTGVDPEPTAVRLALEMLKDCDNCTVTEGSAYGLPFADCSFDVVVMADVIEHLDDDDLAMREAARVLKPDGLVLISTPRRRPGRPLGEDHVREYTAAELKELCESHFEMASIFCLWPLLWTKLYRTKIGWRVIRELGRYVYNPFHQEGTDPKRFAQLLVACSSPNGRISLPMPEESEKRNSCVRTHASQVVEQTLEPVT